MSTDHHSVPRPTTRLLGIGTRDLKNRRALARLQAILHDTVDANDPVGTIVRVSTYR